MYRITRIVRFVRNTRKTRNLAVKMNEEKRKIESERAKLQKNLSNGDDDNNQRSALIFDASSESELSAIFTLNNDCLDTIFDYLSMKDIHSFGQTCKIMQQIAGEYFERNFKSTEKFSGIDGIYSVSGLNERTRTSAFNQFINYFSHYYENMEPLRYIQLHCDEFKSLNHIYLVCLKLNTDKTECIRQILGKLEILQIRQCTLDGDFYESFLKYCRNLKRIYIQDDLGYILDENQNPWLLQEYPQLEHLQLIPRYSFKINELNRFFERNPQIQSFSTSSRCLWENRAELGKSNIKLDKLEIQILDNYHRHLINMQSICNLLNEFFERGFYRRLYLYVKRVDKQCSEHVIKLHALEMLSIRQFSECHSLYCLSNLRELEIMNSVNIKDLEILASNLTNLERLSLSNTVTGDDIICLIVPFVRCSTKLYRMQVNFNEGYLNLYKLNEERKRLATARKIIIYVSNPMFLETKWKTMNGEINLDFIEMRRSSQC